MGLIPFLAEARNVARLFEVIRCGVEFVLKRYQEAGTFCKSGHKRKNTESDDRFIGLSLPRNRGSTAGPTVINKCLDSECQ